METPHFCHEHPLTLDEVQKDDDGEVTCCGCLKTIVDSAYGCKKGRPLSDATLVSRRIKTSLIAVPNALSGYTSLVLCCQRQRSNDHVHPLVLAYSLPTEDSMFENYCDICSQSVHPSAWLYYCGDCKYYAHIVCAMSELSRSSWPTEPILKKDSFSVFFLGGGSEVIHENFETDKVALPLRDGALDLISQLLKALGFEDDDTEKECSHFSHRHPLLLADIQSTDEVLVLCDGCVQPISGPSYSCRKCDFFLHSSCAKLPPKVKHPFHPEHPLDLKMARNSVAITECSGCRTFCNGLTYRCESCKFYLDVKCAILPRNIKHEAVGRLTSRLVKNDGWCSSCQGSFSGIIYVSESERLPYQVSTVCAQLPRMVKHRYDEHPLKLTYSPIPDRPGEYVCEICEKFLNPEHWFYHCLECDYSFHVGCISPHPYTNIKFGSTYRVDRHPHSLTLRCESKNKTPSPCDCCGGLTAGMPVLGCESCNFQLGLTCATNIIDSSSTNALQPLS
ncbi:hypothetical protein RJ640_010725 [Escallonia rubra]|uniref:DC1 domain-containing protein n=1 Tax=Escallonia rubra TaxID=112253 RepID=A0AA88QZ55_9ASTE|nr:hypothetical protein RJ640_010725 [Escallonia rubra]